MKILITGGAGFVGSSLAYAFKKDQPQSEIVVLDNLRRRGSEINLSEFKKLGIQFFHGDIRNFSDLQDLPGKFDVFIEASAEPSVLAGLQGGTPQYLLDTNLKGTLNCLEFARERAEKLVFLSTSRVYSIQPLKEIQTFETASRFEIGDTQKWPGLSKKGISEDFPTHLPRSLYGATKLASELMIQEYCFSYGLQAVMNRCGVIAGPGQFGKTDQGVFTLWVANHYFQKPLKYTGFGGEGKQVRDLLHPLDLYDLICKQLQTPRLNGEVYNAGGGREISTSLNELTALCQRVLGKQTPIGKDLSTSAVDIPLYVTDTSKANKTFAWQPRRSVENIVQEIADWIHQNEAALRLLFT